MKIYTQSPLCLYSMCICLTGNFPVLRKRRLIGNNSACIGRLCKMKVFSAKSGKKISCWDFLRKDYTT